MVVGKQVADGLTSVRLFLGIGLIWLGMSHGEAAFPLAAILLMLSWTTDALDGPVARRSGLQYQTWIGDHDLEIDMFVGLGVLLYLYFGGFIVLVVTLVYLVAWGTVFLAWGHPRSFGMLFQAPVYGWFIWVAFHVYPPAGAWLSIWVIIAVVITWPRFPQEIVPGFLSGLANAFSESIDKKNRQAGNGRPHIQ
jgi:phosphatidylglycerophosphate synthase